MITQAHGEVLAGLTGGRTRIVCLDRTTTGTVLGGRGYPNTLGPHPAAVEPALPGS